MYCHEDAGEKPFGGTEGECKTGNRHREEGERRRQMDEVDRNNIAEELQKHSHNLNVIGITESEKFAALFPAAFHSKIERKVKTMQYAGLR